MKVSRTVLYLCLIGASWIPLAAAAEGLYLARERAGYSPGTTIAIPYSPIGLTLWARSDAAFIGSGMALGADQNPGTSFGGGVSYSFTPRLSATLEWGSNDYRYAIGGREAVRSTSLGLQYRY
jgi:hypothetical protein